MRHRSKFGTLMRMLSLVKPLRGYMCLAVLAGTLAYLAVQFIPVFGAFAVAYGMGYSVPLPIQIVWTGLIVLALLRSVLRYVEQRTNHYIAFTLLAMIRDRVFAALRRLCPAKLESRDKGDLINLITSDVELLEVFYAHTISPICIAVLVEAVMVIFIGSYHVLLGVIAVFAFLFIGIAVPAIISKLSGDVGEQVRKESGELASYVLQNIRGVDEILQYNAGKERLQGMNRRTEKLVRQQEKLNHLTGLNMAISGTAILMFDLLMMAASVSLLHRGAIGMDGLIISCIAFMSSFGPVAALAGLGTTLQNTIASGERVLSIIDEEPETGEITGMPEINFSGAACKDVTFAYDGDPILSNFSMTFPKDKIIGVVGKSGSGKSTMLKLLMRFWRVGKGEVSISGTSVENINTGNLRQMESYMTQETHLFKDTIAGNIRIGRLDATQEEIEEACRKASIHDFIMTLPKGYETEVGELGETLSGGERQRIGLARAFLHNAPFILLDEPTSNLDSLNEAVILKSLKEASADKTVVLVSHRYSTVRIADHVYAVNDS